MKCGLCQEKRDDLIDGICVDCLGDILGEIAENNIAIIKERDKFESLTKNKCESGNGNECRCKDLRKQIKDLEETIGQMQNEINYLRNRVERPREIVIGEGMYKNYTFI